MRVTLIKKRVTKSLPYFFFSKTTVTSYNVLHGFLFNFLLKKLEVSKGSIGIPIHNPKRRLFGCSHYWHRLIPSPIHDGDEMRPINHRSITQSRLLARDFTKRLRIYLIWVLNEILRIINDERERERDK